MNSLRCCSPIAVDLKDDKNVTKLTGLALQKGVKH